mgnify:CR=1 FL=1
MDLVTLVMLTNAIAPRQQRVDIRAVLQRKQLQRFLARDLPAVQDSLAQLRNPSRYFRNIRVNLRCTHG